MPKLHLVVVAFDELIVGIHDVDDLLIAFLAEHGGNERPERATRCGLVSSPSRSPLRGTIVTGKLDHDGFLALSNSNSALPRCWSSSDSRNALALATARATTWSSPVGRPKNRPRKRAPQHIPRASPNLLPHLRYNRPCSNSWNRFLLMGIPRFGFKRILDFQDRMAEAPAADCSRRQAGVNVCPGLVAGDAQGQEADENEQGQTHLHER